MKGILVITALAAGLPALAVPNCNAPQVVQGNNCTLTASLGWVIAGLGTNSVFTEYVPPNATGPVSFQITALNSSLGSSYNGYFGIKASSLDGTGTAGPFTLSDIIAFGPDIVSPGETSANLITQVCWDPTCTSAAPAGAMPNMLSAQVLISAPNTTDINTNDLQLTVRFLTADGRVNLETQETALRTNSQYSIIPGINLGATPAGRYVFTGPAVNLPYAGISISNLNNPNPVTGTATLKSSGGNVVATAPIPAIPPGGAAGYLVIGRTPGDPLGLFPSSLVLPADSQGVFHGTLEIATSGQTVNGQLIILLQEYNGNAMLNAFVFHSAVP
jgi:hypothetical protein